MATLVGFASTRAPIAIPYQEDLALSPIATARLLVACALPPIATVDCPLLPALPDLLPVPIATAFSPVVLAFAPIATLFASFARAPTPCATVLAPSVLALLPIATLLAPCAEEASPKATFESPPVPASFNAACTDPAKAVTAKTAPSTPAFIALPLTVLANSDTTTYIFFVLFHTTRYI